MKNEAEWITLSLKQQQGRKAEWSVQEPWFGGWLDSEKKKGLKEGLKSIEIQVFAT